MAISVNNIVARAQTILQDTTSIRWPELELVDWINDAQREVVMLVPQAGATTLDVTLDPLDSLQRLPSDAIQFLRVIRNVGGRAIRAADRDILDAQIPGWHQLTDSEVIHYVHDPMDPTTFYVYPRATGSVEVVYAKSPNAVTAGQNLAIPDVYANSVLDYILYRAYSKDAEATANRDLAVKCYERFVGALGMKMQAMTASVYGTPVQRASPVGS